MRVSNEFQVAKVSQNAIVLKKTFHISLRFKDTERENDLFSSK